MIAIIGGGICGLSIGWYLAKAGQAVTILERGQAGHGATWAAAGMLTPWSFIGSDEEPVFQLHLASHAMWPDFGHALESTTGVAIDYRTEGRLFIILDHEDARGLRTRYEFNRKLGLSLEWLSGDEARRREPHLASTVTDAVFMPTGHVVDNRKVVMALQKAFRMAGGILREQSKVVEIVIERNRVQGVRLANEFLAVETVVLAAGVWSRDIPGLPRTVRPPVRPIKGQMLALQMPPESPLLEHMVTGQVYIIPRSDGRLLVGATIEEKGFDSHVTAGAIFEMLAQARRILPAIDNLPLIETWAGLRPASDDEAPILGTTRVDGLIVATGHFRHGILLAPITGQAISQFILTGKVMDEIRFFTPSRFSY